VTSVLVGVDGSEGSRRAAAFGRDLARAFDARLTLLHVIEPHPTETMGGLDDSHKQWYEAQMRHATDLLAELAVELHATDAERAIEMGHASDVICREAEERNADMIVVGRNGRRLGPRIMPGSVGAYVSAAATRSVTIVR
jgi:nucleotide-binding universal stress UspA family protein